MNESRRRELQDMIEEAVSNNGNKTYLHILSQYRLLVSNSSFLVFPDLNNKNVTSHMLSICNLLFRE
jgi:hypothetical protein